MIIFYPFQCWNESFVVICCFVADIPMEMFIIITAGIVIIIAVIIITIIIKCTCNKNRTTQEHYPHFDANSVPPNYGYTSSKAHQRSSWACAFKGGQQMNTHIWETPLPEPHEGEYILPAGMTQQMGIGSQAEQNQLGNERVGTGGTSRRFHPHLPPNLNQSQTPVPMDIQVKYTMPEQHMPTQLQGDPIMASTESEYTMPVKIKTQANPVTDSTTYDYTIPVLPQPVPDKPDSESEYTVPTVMDVPDKQYKDVAKESSLREIL